VHTRAPPPYGKPTMANWPCGELAIWQTGYGKPAYGDIENGKTM